MAFTYCLLPPVFNPQLPVFSLSLSPSHRLHRSPIYLHLSTTIANALTRTLEIPLELFLEDRNHWHTGIPKQTRTNFPLHALQGYEGGKNETKKRHPKMAGIEKLEIHSKVRGSWSCKHVVLTGYSRTLFAGQRSMRDIQSPGVFSRIRNPCAYTQFLLPTPTPKS